MPATHTASYAIQNCQYNSGMGTDLERRGHMVRRTAIVADA